jgi:hypothetical protein
MTATPSAPAWMTSGTRVALMPPIARIGKGQIPRLSRMAGVRAPHGVLDGVA